MTEPYDENVVLRDFDFWVDTGELVTFVPPSGGGKTTLLNILGGLTAAGQGVVKMTRQDLSQLGEDSRASLKHHVISIAHQSNYLFPQLSMNKNLEIGPDSRAPAPWFARVRRNLRIDDFHGTETNKLFGGQRRRVYILRALQMETEVLLLDEPTTGLDDRLVSYVRRALQDLIDRGYTVIVATHEEAASAAAGRAAAPRGKRTIL